MSINNSKRQRTHSSTDDDNLFQLDEENNTENWPHPALLNHVIIQLIFENLDEDDFRNCRLVCKKWKSVGESSFKKKVRLCLRFEEEDDEESGDEVHDDIEAKFAAPTDLVEFFEMSQNEFPFTAVSFIGRLPWASVQISNLFSTEGRFITDLTFENVALKLENYTTENKNFLESYDLTPILSRIENLKRLTLIREDNPYHRVDSTTRWIVSFENLKNIQHVNIETCSIEFKTNPLIISPIYLRLDDVTFYRDNKDLKNIHLNEFVNFEVMENLSLSVSRVKITKISLDVSGNAVVLKKAEFFKIDLVNFEESGWIVDKLECSFSPFDKPTKMIVKQLEITDCDCVFQMLPNSLHVLRLRENVNIVENTEPIMWNISFPHLKRLELTEIDVIDDCLPYLTRYCHHLEKLALDSCDELERVTIDMHMIPPTVKHLTLRGEYEFVREGALVKVHWII